MKQQIILWIGALLLLTAGIGCEKEKVHETFSPIKDIPEQVSVFFEKKLPVASESTCFFKSSKKELFHVINSMEELQAVYSCEEKLPEIDFMRYSVVIGQKTMPNSYYSVSNQRIVELSEVLELNIIAKTLSEGVWPSFSMMYCWGIYPKLPNKKLNVNVEIE